MKKLIASLLLATSLASIKAQEFRSVDFLGSHGPVILFNSNTVLYGAVSVPYTNNIATANWYTNGVLPIVVFSMTNLYSTNFLLSSTSFTNANIGQFDPAWIDAKLAPDRNGGIGKAALAVSVSGVDAIGTNTITFIVEKLTRQWNPSSSTWTYIPGNTTADQWTFSIAPTFASAGNTTSTTLVTNVPDAMVQGSWGLRVQSIAVNSNSYTNRAYNLNAMTLNYFQP